MTSNKVINVFFIALMFFSFLLVVGAFFTWNDPFEYDVKKNMKFESFNIEKCQLRNNKIIVSGWVYAPDYPYARYSVFVERNSGKFRKLETFSKERKDVQKALDVKDYQVSGFEASYRGFDSNYTGLITVQAESNYNNGRAYSVQYRCEG